MLNSSSVYVPNVSGNTALMKVGSQLFYAAQSSTAGIELFHSDGTAAGTGLVKDIRPGVFNSSPTLMGELNGRLYFAADDGGGYRLWSTDGTAAGTQKVSNTPLSPQAKFHVAATVGNVLYFSGGFGTTDAGLWKTDGTSAGTALVKAFTALPDHLAVSNGRLFARDSLASGTELWTSNGTTSGTQLLRQFGSMDLMTPFAGRVFFAASDAATGTEVWSSDGTVPGTQIVQDVVPGSGSGGGSGIGAAGGMLLYSAETTATGQEPWKWVPDSNLPLANAGGPQSVAEGATLVLSGSGAAVPGATISSYAWDLNYDGVTFHTTATTATPTFDAASLDGPTTRNVALRVVDSLGRTSAVSTAIITVTNAPPTGTFSNSGPVVAGGSATVSFTGVVDRAADAAAGFRYSFDFDNDGAFELSDVSTASVSIPANYLQTSGSRAVGGRVKDKDGGFSDYTTTVTITAPAWLSPGSAASWDASTKTLTVTGAANVTGDAGVDSANVKVVGASAALTIAPTSGVKVALASLDISAGGNVLVQSLGGSRTAANHRVLIVNALSIDSTSKLDLADNDLIIDYSGATVAGAVESLVRRGFNYGDWLGTGITSSVAAAPASNGNYALGVAENSLLVNPFGNGSTTGPLFSGQSVDNTCVLVKFTQRVDLDLNGLVDANDAAIFNGAFSEGDSGATWMAGDVDFDGLYSSNDAAIFNSFYDESLPQL